MYVSGPSRQRPSSPNCPRVFLDTRDSYPVQCAPRGNIRGELALRGDRGTPEIDHRRQRHRHGPACHHRLLSPDREVLLHHRRVPAHLPVSPYEPFGLGFLSVFAVSDNVVVKIWKPSSPSSDAPIRLSLTGPRGLRPRREDPQIHKRHKGVRSHPREFFPKGVLTSYLTELCPMVEFPIIVDDLGSLSAIAAEEPSQFLVGTSRRDHKDSYFVTRAFPFNRTGIEGYIYVLAHVTPEGENWARWSWAYHSYPDAPSLCLTPPFSSAFVLSPRRQFRRFTPQFEVPRRSCEPTARFPVLRAMFRICHAARFRNTLGHQRSIPKLNSRLSEIISDSASRILLAKGPGRWKYVQSVSRYFDLPDYWETCGGGPSNIPPRGMGNSFRSLTFVRRTPSPSSLLTLQLPQPQNPDTTMTL